MILTEQFILESKNTHMEHLEDLVFNEGVLGARKAIGYLQGLRDMLSGNSAARITATVKWDGAPAIFAGIDPRDGKFFVAKKGIFNKEPKVYKTHNDIHLDTSGDLAEKLSIALTELKKVGIKDGVYQGDIMFTKKDLKRETIDGEQYITFHPNTIVYAVPRASFLGKRISEAKIGVIWHTKYTGDSFENMKASFGVDITKGLTKTSTVWMDDATYKDYSGSATFTAQETKAVTSMLSEIGSLFRSIPASTFNGISNNPDLLLLVKTYNNSKIRVGSHIQNYQQHVQGLYHWIHDRYQKEIENRKTDKAKTAQEQKRKDVLGFFANNDISDISNLFKLWDLLSKVKYPIIEKMNQVDRIGTFIRTKSGYKVTGVEGFVAIDHLQGGAVKIVDRMEFSYSNFNPEVIKGWQR